MHNKVNICIVGAGNISNTRHIPALKKVSEARIVGVLSNRYDKARQTAQKHGIDNYSEIKDKSIDIIKNADSLPWLSSVDAVVIGAPPHLHYELTKAFLNLGKHVLVEKPMMMNEDESRELIKLAKEKRKVFYVMHNFQYARKMLKLNEIVESKKHGEIVSITEVQFTNHDRRLPEWYNDLPLGLFYDEAAHFMYLLERHAGKLKIDSVHSVRDKDSSQSTPITLTVGATAGSIPVTMMLNFRAPICEWQYIVSFSKRIFIYDFFKDILVELPTDNEHRAKDILLNSIRFTWQYWVQFMANGLRMVSGSLLYGHDVVLRSFTRAILGGKPDESLMATSGLKNVISINQIVDMSNKR